MSLRNAINAKCRDCIYDPKSGLGGVRQQINACTCTQCPLYEVRLKNEPKRPLSQILEDNAALLFNGMGEHEQ